jgi:hypothetical protein
MSALRSVRIMTTDAAAPDTIVPMSAQDGWEAIADHALERAVAHARTQEPA